MCVPCLEKNFLNQGWGQLWQIAFIKLGTNVPVRFPLTSLMYLQLFLIPSDRHAAGISCGANRSSAAERWSGLQRHRMPGSGKVKNHILNSHVLFPVTIEQL